MATTIDLPWFQFYANDFLAQTRRLSNEEVGIYSILMAASWLNGPMPLEAVQSWVGEGYESVLSRFFKPDDNGDLYHPKLEELRQGAIETAQKNRERTEKATAARMNKDSTSRTRHVDVAETDIQSHIKGHAQGNLQPEGHGDHSHTQNTPEVEHTTPQAERESLSPSSAASRSEDRAKLAELEHLWASTPQSDRQMKSQRRKAYFDFRKGLENKTSPVAAS